MIANGKESRIENLIRDSKWGLARKAIEKQLAEAPDDHWLWSRLSGVMYEQRNYEEALKAAKRALQILPDCPLALWSQANALDMLGKPAQARKAYLGLLRRSVEELKAPDDDANECWEGEQWTYGLMMDCLYRLAGCWAKSGERDLAFKLYRMFLGFLDLLDLSSSGNQSIYTRQDAIARLKQLVPVEKNMPAEMERAIQELEEVMG